jgi:hypothetical protein
MMPPQIRPKYKQIIIRFFKAEKLPLLDVNLLGKATSIDAYLTCKYLSHKLTTDVITAKEADRIDWNTEFLLPVQLPVMSGRVAMQIYDKDNIKDEIVGSILFNLKECMEPSNNGKFSWCNIYGAPLGHRGSITDTMNSNPEAASAWKGRILVQVLSEDTEKPTCIKRKIDPKNFDLAKPYMEMREYDVIADVYSGIALPSEDKYRVMIKIADFELITEAPKFALKNYNRWNCRFR